MGRAPCCDKASVKKGPWAPEEDAKLKAYIEQHGTGGNWIALPQKIGLKRCGKSCRLRWLNYLRPNIKHGGFTEEEDNIICSLYISIGSRWSIIAAQLPGRTDNDIKNYWNTRLKKKLLGRRKSQNRTIAGKDLYKDATNAAATDGRNSCNNWQNLSSSALERLQLHMQLQNPFSLYENNPAIWPKLNPLMIQSLLNQSNSPVYQNPYTNPHEPDSLVLDQTHNNPIIDDPAVNGSFSSPESSFSALNNDPISSTFQESGFMEQKNMMERKANSGFTQAELDELLLNSKSSSLLPNDQVDFDCFNVSRDINASWWANELEAASAFSSSSWLNHQLSDQEMQNQDCTAIGYDLQ